MDYVDKFLMIDDKDIEKVRKELERDIEIYGSCTDGSGSQVRYHLRRFEEKFGKEAQK